MLRIEILSPNPQKFVNSLLFIVFLFTYLNCFILHQLSNYFLKFRFNRMLQRYFLTKRYRVIMTQKVNDLFLV